MSHDIVSDIYYDIGYYHTPISGYPILYPILTPIPGFTNPDIGYPILVPILNPISGTKSNDICDMMSRYRSTPDIGTRPRNIGSDIGTQLT